MKKEVPVKMFRCSIPMPKFLKRLRLVRHVRMVARIRDCNSSPEVKAACTALLHSLVNGEK